MPPEPPEKSRIPLQLCHTISNISMTVSLVRRIGSFRSSIRSSSSNNDRQPLLVRPAFLASSVATSTSLSTTAPYTPSIISQSQLGKKISVTATSDSSLRPIEEELERGNKYLITFFVRVAFLLANSQPQLLTYFGILTEEYDVADLFKTTRTSKERLIFLQLQLLMQSPSTTPKFSNDWSTHTKRRTENILCLFCLPAFATESMASASANMMEERFAFLQNLLLGRFSPTTTSYLHGPCSTMYWAVFMHSELFVTIL